MHAVQTLQKWGNSAGIRLPKEILVALRIKVNQQLSVTVQNGSILLTPLEDRAAKDLERLLEGVTPALIGGEMDWGSDLGAEVYE